MLREGATVSKHIADEGNRKAVITTVKSESDEVVVVDLCTREPSTVRDHLGVRVVMGSVRVVMGSVRGVMGSVRDVMGSVRDVMGSVRDVMGSVRGVMGVLGL